MATTHILEIGTNSLKYLKADISSHQPAVICEKVFPTRIGSGLQKNGYISHTAFLRNLDTIEGIIETVDNPSCSNVHIFATQGLRIAANAEEFTACVQNTTGCPVTILSGEQEAELAYAAVSASLCPQDSLCAVADIGGGSTEISTGRGNKVHSRLSLPYGAVNLTEKYLPEDTISQQQIDTLTAFLQHTFKAYAVPACPAGLIGVGGTVVTAAGLLKDTHPEALEGTTLHLQEIDLLITRLAALTLPQRKALPHMPEGRADIITAGLIILSTLMQHLGIKSLRVSTRGVRWGYLYKLMQEAGL